VLALAQSAHQRFHVGAMKKQEPRLRPPGRTTIAKVPVGF